MKGIYLDPPVRVQNPKNDYVSYMYLIREAESRAVAGSCSLRRGNVPEHVGNIGFEIDEKFRGRGYATEAVRLLAAEARRLGIGELTVSCRSESSATARICEKLGARPSGSVTAEVLGEKRRYFIYKYTPYG